MHTSVPTEAISVYNSALELSNREDYDNALKEYRKALAIFPSFVEAHNNIGEIYSRMGRSEEAINAYKDALKISKNYKVLLNIGVEFFLSGNEDTALKYFLESVSVKKDFIEGNFYAGLVYYNRKEMKKASKYLEAVISVDKKHIKANYLLSYIYYEQKDYKKTIECLERIKDIADDKSFINRYYGFCCYYLGRYKEAISYLTEALEAKPEYAKFRDYLESLTVENKMKEVGDLDSSIKELEEKIMNETPDFKEATKLSMLYIFKGENKKAEKMLLSVKEKLAS